MSPEPENQEPEELGYFEQIRAAIRAVKELGPQRDAQGHWHFSTERDVASTYALAGLNEEGNESRKKVFEQLMQCGLEAANDKAQNSDHALQDGALLDDVTRIALKYLKETQEQIKYGWEKHGDYFVLLTQPSEDEMEPLINDIIFDITGKEPRTAVIDREDGVKKIIMGEGDREEKIAADPKDPREEAFGVALTKDELSELARILGIKIAPNQNRFEAADYFEQIRVTLVELGQLISDEKKGAVEQGGIPFGGKKEEDHMDREARIATAKERLTGLGQLSILEALIGHDVGEILKSKTKQVREEIDTTVLPVKTIAMRLARVKNQLAKGWKQQGDQFILFPDRADEGGTKYMPLTIARGHTDYQLAVRIVEGGKEKILTGEKAEDWKKEHEVKEEDRGVAVSRAGLVKLEDNLGIPIKQAQGQAL